MNFKHLLAVRHMTHSSRNAYASWVYSQAKRMAAEAKMPAASVAAAAKHGFASGGQFWDSQH